MQAVQISEFGGPGAMQLVDLPVPPPGPGEVLVRNEAVGLNFIDCYHRSGLYPIALPFTPGLEGAGVVEAVGEGVAAVSVGDRVVYIEKSLGAYAAATIVAADNLIPLPGGIGSELAAAITLKGLTAHYLCRSTFPVEKGHWALVHAAAGSTGSILVQMLGHLGAQVIATAGGAEKVERTRRLGADHAIDYEAGDFVEAVQKITGGRGVDVVYDGVGRATFSGSLQCLRPRGTMVSFGNASGPVEPLSPLELANAGSLYLTRPTLAHYIANREELMGRAGELFGWISCGVLELAVACRYPLSDAARAHRDLEGRRIPGPPLLIPEQD